MKKFNIYVVEDMAISRAVLIDWLEESNYNVVGSAANADKAWEDLQHLSVDLALLDINLAGKKDGIWIAEQIRKNLNIPIVFLTAYGDEETITKLSKLNPNGYLMKPYNQPTLITTINIALKTFESLNEIKSDRIIKPLFFIIEQSNKKIKINLVDLLYIVSDGNYLELHFQDKFYIIRDKLTRFIETLPQNNFIQLTHLRYAVNINKITSLDAKKIMINDIEIPVSKSHKATITACFNNK